MKIKITSIFSALFLTFVMLFSFGALQIHASETVNVVGHQYAPYQNPDKSGFQNELVREAFKAVDIIADIKIVPPLRTIQTFYSSQFLVCADGETLNDEQMNR